jgi:hypothetical protein
MEEGSHLVSTFILVSHELKERSRNLLICILLAHLTGYPGLPDPAPKLDGLVSLIKTLSEKPDVWFVTNQQLLQWMKNPVKSSELGKQDYMRCEQPVISKEICNGLDDDNNANIDDGLLNR